MKKIGIIGFGSMGQMLAEGVLRIGTVQPENLFVSSRNIGRTDDFAKKYPAVNICAQQNSLVKASDIIFICVPPDQVRTVLLSIGKDLDGTKHIISIAGYVSLENICSIITGPVSKIIPSFVSKVDEGVFLSCHNDLVTSENTKQIRDILGKMGDIHEIKESQFEVYSDVTSCAPGFFSAIFSEFIKAARRHGEIDEEKARTMFVQTLYGIAKLYKTTNISFQETISRVARKGGITETAVSVIENKLPEVYDELFEKTIEKHELRKKEMKADYSL